MFWNETIPQMLLYASNTSNLQSISSKIPILTQRNSKTIELTRAEILMILISMFLCMLPKQSHR
jgi:hypothetical protein